MLDGLVAEFLPKLLTFVIALLIGAVPYVLVSRRRPELRPRARAIYVGAAFLSAFVVADYIDLAPRDETDPGLVITDLGPVIEAGRTERVAEGFAVTFPDDWTVREPTVSVPRDQEGMDVLLAAYSAEPQQACTVIDATRRQQVNSDWGSLDDAVAGDLESYGLDPTTVDVDSGYIDLPSGHAAYTGRLREDGLYSRAYYLVSADHRYVFGCGSRDRPDDDWLSIAETFEFLPGEEEPGAMLCRRTRPISLPVPCSGL